MQSYGMWTCWASHSRELGYLGCFGYSGAMCWSQPKMVVCRGQDEKGKQENEKGR